MFVTSIVSFYLFITLVLIRRIRYVIFWFIFSCIWTERLLSKSPYSVLLRENIDQKTNTGTFHAVIIRPNPLSPWQKPLSFKAVLYQVKGTCYCGRINFKVFIRIEGEGAIFRFYRFFSSKTSLTWKKSFKRNFIFSQVYRNQCVGR